MESSLEGNGGDLMDQCSWHDTPPAFSVNLTNWLGHDLDIGLSALESRVLTSQWLGGKNAPFEANLPVPLGDTSVQDSGGGLGYLPYASTNGVCRRGKNLRVTLS